MYHSIVWSNFNFLHSSLCINFLNQSYVLFLLILFTHQSFSHQFKLMVFYWSLSDSKSPQVSWTLLSILAVLNNDSIWMVSTRPPNSSCPLNNPFVTVPNAPIKIGIIFTFMFHSFFSSLARSRYLSFFSLSFSFILWSTITLFSPQFCNFSFFKNYFMVWFSSRD